MEESQELWLMTSVSILGACGVAHFIRYLLNMLMGVLMERNLESEQPSKKLITKGKMLKKVSKIINAAISTYMLVVGTYEKCLLIGKGLVVEYYASTLVLCVVYSYTLQQASPNPLTVVKTHWNKLMRKKENFQEANINNNNINSIKPMDISPQGSDGVRRRVGEVSAVVPMSSDDVVMSQKRKAHDSIWTFFRVSWPSLLGQFIGLEIAIFCLNIVWDGYLTNHHLDNTGLLQKCIICLQTGPVQGFIVEAAISFFLSVFIQWLTNQPSDGALGLISRSFFLTACIQSVVVTTVLYIFINVTGAFANPLLAYALERKCLNDVTSIINHIIVYCFGALAGTILFKVIPPQKHFSVILFIFGTFSILYNFVPGILNKDLFSF